MIKRAFLSICILLVLACSLQAAGVSKRGVIKRAPKDTGPPFVEEIYTAIAEVNDRIDSLPPETDPTVDESVKDGVDWAELSNIPAGFADGIDDASAGDSDWIISGDDMYSGVSGNAGIGTASPSEKLHVEGNAKVTGNLIVEGNISGSIDFSQITGLLGTGYSLVFPDIIDNLTTIEIDGIEMADAVVVVHGPGYDIERIEGFFGDGTHDDQPGLSMEHPLIFECSGTGADNVQAYFDDYFADPLNVPAKVGSIIIFDLSSTEVMRWNFLEFIPQSYEPGGDGRTRFTMVNRFIPNTHDHWRQGESSDAFGSQLSNNPLTDSLVEIDGIGSFYPEVAVDEPNRTLTFTYDFVEGHGIWGWAIYTIKGLGGKRALVVIEEEDGVEVSRNNYSGCFPIKYEQVTGFGLDTKIKAKVVVSYDFREAGL